MSPAPSPQARRALERLRRCCLALPEAVEQETWEEATFRVRTKIFVIASARTTGARATLKATREDQAALLAEGEPYAFPSYVGRFGWIGVDLLSGALDWQELDELVREAYCLVAPKRLQQQLGASGPPRNVTSPRKGEPA